MRTQDLTPEQRRELLDVWNHATRAWWSDRDINWLAYVSARVLFFGVWDRIFGPARHMVSPERVAWGE